MKSFRLARSTWQENLGGAIAIVGLALLPIIMGKGWLRPESPWSAIALCWGVVAYWSYHSLHEWWRLRRSPVRRHPRCPPEAVQDSLVWQATLCVMLGILHSSDSWTAASVGLETPIAPPLAFALGLAAYPLFLLFTRCARFHLLDGKPDVRAWVNDMGRSFPRTRVDRAVAWIANQMNPFTEEFVTRGVLVLMLSAQGVGLVPAAILGAVLSAAVHAYQGIRTIPFHVAFFMATVGILVTPAGLWGCFGFHFAADAAPWLLFRRTLRGGRKWRAATWAAAQAATAASQRSSLSKSSTDP